MPVFAQEAAELPPAEAIDPWDALAAYQFGDSHAPLLAIEAETVASMKEAEARQALAARLAALLDDDITYDAKLFICRQLVKVGAAPEVPALAALLTEEKLTDPARYALERIPGEAATQALLEAMANTQGEIRAGMAAALGRRGDDAAVPELLKLTEAEDDTVAMAAVSALGALGSEAARDALVQARASVPEPRRASVAHALLVAADSQAAAGDKEGAQKIYQDLYGSDEPAPVRTAAFLGLARAKGEAAMDEVMAALQGDDRNLARAAGKLLYDLPGDGVTLRLADAVAGMPVAGQLVVIPALAARGGDAARAAVTALLNAESEAVRAAATVAIAKIGDASSVMPMVALAAQWSGRERVEIRQSLLALPGNGVDAAILDALDSADPAMQEELIRAAAGRRIEGAVPRLIALTGAENAGVRERAFSALGELAVTKDMPALLALLENTPGSGDLPMLEEAIVAVAAKPGDAQGAGGQLLAALEASGDPASKAAILRIMGALGAPEAFPTVKRHLDHPEPIVRLAALTALTKLSDPGVRQELKQVYDAAEDDETRAIALQGYVRLLGDVPSDEGEAHFKELFDGAANTKELGIAVEGLGNVHRGFALELAAAQLGNDDVQRQAVAAVLKLARPLVGAYPDQVDAALTKLVALRDNDAVRSQADAIRKLLADAGDFIVAWEWAGPFTLEGGGRTEILQEVFPPETGDAGVHWQVYPLDTNAENPGIIDFHPLAGGDLRAAYLRTTLVAPEAMEVTALTGSDDSMKVWVNGAEVHAIDATRGVKPGTDQFPVSLNAGENAVLVKVVNASGNWATCVSIAGADGHPIDGLTAQIP
jgi:HEAT repeat protein